MMMDNIVYLKGTTEYFQSKQLESGQIVSSFKVVQTIKKKDGTTAKIYHNCQVWGNAQLQNNEPVFVVGRLSNRSYKDKDGQTKWLTEVNCDMVSKVIYESYPQAQQSQSDQNTQMNVDSNTINF